MLRSTKVRRMIFLFAATMMTRCEQEGIQKNCISKKRGRKPLKSETRANHGEEKSKFKHATPLSPTFTLSLKKGFL